MHVYIVVIFADWVIDTYGTKVVKISLVVRKGVRERDPKGGINIDIYQCNTQHTVGA
jgi:hypothetical protein